MNDAQQQTSAVVDGNDSDVDSDDDAPMGHGPLGAVVAAGVGDGGGAGAVCSVFCGLLVLFIAPLAPLVSSKSPPPSRWAVGHRLRARYRPVFFFVEKIWFGTGPAKNSTYLPGECVAIRLQNDQNGHLGHNGPNDPNCLVFYN